MVLKQRINWKKKKKKKKNKHFIILWLETRQ